MTTTNSTSVNSWQSCRELMDTLPGEDQVRWAAKAASSCLRLFEAAYAPDARPRDALGLVARWLDGKPVDRYTLRAAARVTAHATRAADAAGDAAGFAALAASEVDSDSDACAEAATNAVYSAVYASALAESNYPDTCIGHHWKAVQAMMLAEPTRKCDGCREVVEAWTLRETGLCEGCREADREQAADNAAYLADRGC